MTFQTGHKRRDWDSLLHRAGLEAYQARLVLRCHKQIPIVHGHITGIVRHGVALRPGQLQPPQLGSVIGVDSDQQILTRDD